MLSTALVLLALAAAAGAETGGMLLECPGRDGWALYRDHFEASCMRLMPKPELFDDAFKACFAMESRMLSLLHKRSKVLFVNDLIIRAAGENSTTWFFDPLDTHQDLVKEAPPPPPAAAAASTAPRWLVISPSADQSKIELLVNMTEVPRSFICEAPARPAAQRAQFEREPEDVFVSDELLPPADSSDAKPTSRQQPPFIVTFNCQAYGIPKPTVEWVLTGESDDDNRTLSVEPINATVIHDPRLPLAEVQAAEATTVFFNLQRDCKRQPCPPDSIQERSQLIAVNPQHLLGRRWKRVACVARNDFGATLSREAQIFVARLGEFANRTEAHTVRTGLPAVLSNAISAEPDAATAECFRLLRPAGAPAKLVPMQEVNAVTRGAIQMSRATFDLIIDAAAPDDAGEYVCRVRLPNGRLGHVIREKTIRLSVEPCSAKADSACDLSAKPVAVVPGYPRVLSMNPLSNRVVRAGDDFLLECPCTGKRHPDEELTVNWRLNNGTDLAASLAPVLPQGSALLMRGADPRVHGGTYECQCARSAGYDLSYWSSVHVAILPAAAPPAANFSELVVRVKAGQAASIQCRVPGAVPGTVAVSVQPLRGIKPLAETVAGADAARFSVVSSEAGGQFSLTIADVKEADADVYGCRVAASYLDGRWVDYNTYYTTLVVDKAQ